VARATDSSTEATARSSPRAGPLIGRSLPSGDAEGALERLEQEDNRQEGLAILNMALAASLLGDLLNPSTLLMASADSALAAAAASSPCA
jgi:hypothetical protein